MYLQALLQLPKIQSVKITSYDEEDNPLGSVRGGFEESDYTLKGKRLVVDDLIDSGATLQYVRDHVVEACDTAVIYATTEQKENVDFYGEEVDGSERLVFPREHNLLSNTEI